MSVAIVMGSDSDEPVMRQAADALEDFGVDWEMRVLSAHRTPDDAIAFARSARARGVQVIIAGAGGAAHLPGVLAAVTTLPVIGVPIALKTLDGLDSLLSIVQMPRGIPVATVSVDGSRNAGLLAVRMLGVADEHLAGEIERFQERMAAEVRAKDAAMQERLGR
ncbi:MAG: 5-(carboxyamino)imidazole ribonucleotide mutase [Actinomycetota bacterium]|jgi:5-(carboxyamino)imidazole ribonucleotide mutase|nr:5-(carboxyamino)imidazole ribonucleotide mutase [Actinomycetota bacterium]